MIRDLLRAPAVELARMLRRDEVGSRQLVEASIEAIRARNDELQAFVEVLEDSALEAARAADRFRGKDRPPFLGVPIGIKDLNTVRGSATRFGSNALSKIFSPFDDVTVAQLRRAGFVIVGKTATSEFGGLPVTEPDIHPPTRNPWDLGVTPGGSSGGAASAVAAELVPVAQGSDAGGSIRIPSALCHLVGFKPSRGRLKNAYGLPDRDILYTDGPIVRTVGDAAAITDAMAGLTVGEPHWAPPPERPFAELAEQPPRRLSIRFATRLPMFETHPEIVEAVERTARVLERLGHEVDEGGGAPDVSVGDFLPIWQRLMGDMPVSDWSRAQPITRWLGEAGRKVPHEKVQGIMSRLATTFLDWFGGADLWILPSVGVAPLPIGHLAGRDPREGFEEAAKLGAFTAPFNVTGQPAISIPAGLSKDGHPIGVQLAGRRLADATVLAIARVLEQEMPWADRRPPMVR